MQLNNKITGESIEIVSVNFDTNQIYFNTKTIDGDSQLRTTESFTYITETETQIIRTVNEDGQTVLVPTEIEVQKKSLVVLKNYLYQDVNLSEICCNILKNQLHLVDFIVERDSQNWLSVNKCIRMKIPSTLIKESLVNKTPFFTCVNYIIDEQKIDPEIKIINTETYSYIYVNSINEAMLPVLNPLIRNITDANGNTTLQNENGIIDIEYKLNLN